MDLTRTVLELIELRSFSNIWYWIALAAIWVRVSHSVLGVPADMIGRAAKRGGSAEADLETLVRIGVARRLSVARGGVWLIGAVSMVLTGLAVLGFFYAIELAQALVLIAAPLTLVGVLDIRLARRLAAEAPTGAALRRRLIRHRQVVQITGVVSIFVSALWGMFQTLSAAVFF